MSKNRELAEMFNEMADLYEMQGVDWKPAAYRKAARSLESMTEHVEAIYKQDGLKGLKRIPGVGQGIAEKIEEYLKTKKIKEFKKMAKKVPKGVEEMMHVPGMGPKKVMLLYKKLKIKNLRELESAAKKGKLKKLSGFGSKSEQDVLRGLGLLKAGRGRKLLGIAWPLAKELSERLKKVPGVKKVEVAGSLRRMKETVGDIDILVTSTHPKKVMDVFTSMDEVKTVLAKGQTKSTVVLKDGLQADVRVLDPKSFGAALQYFTGSKEHNVKLRRIAIKKGYKLSEYGLFKKNKYVCGRTEKEVYTKLGVKWVPAEMRENTGEIELKKVPKLIGYNALKGDLHMHTKWSDGAHTIEQMARAAQKRGYKYIAITDHSKSQHIAHGMDEKRILKYLKEIEKVQKKVRIKILKGSEVDILADGSLDFDEKILKKLDIVVASVHSGFKTPRKKMTARILKAFENKHVNIFGHPTGRKINMRNPYDFDFEKVAKAAKEKGIALEVDAQPARLDLKDMHVKKALEMGCKLSIDSDTHSAENFYFIELGIAQARRGWAQEKDVINTWPLGKLKKFLKRRK